jgi:hypothetical protein
VHGFADGDALGDILGAPASTLGDSVSNYGVSTTAVAPLEALDSAREKEQLQVAAIPKWGAPRLTHARLAADVKAVSDIPDATMRDELALLAHLTAHFERTRDALRVAQRVAAEPARAAERARVLDLALPREAAAAAATHAAIASAADAADARARRLRAGVDASSSVDGSSARVGVGSGPGAAYLHETDLRLAVVAEGWRAAASRRGRTFTARLRWLATSPAGRKLPRIAAATATAASASLTLPLLVSTPAQLEAELERLCRDFALDAGLTRHSLAAHVRRLFVDVFAAQEARARLIPCEGCDPSIIAARTATAAAAAAGSATDSAANDVPRWGSPGKPRERIFLLDPPVEAGETRVVDADAVMRATMTGGGGGGGGGGGSWDLHHSGGGGEYDDDEDSGGSGGRDDGGRMGGATSSSSSGAGAWSPEDEYWPSGIDDGGGSAAASGEAVEGGGGGGGSDAMFAAARVDQPLQAEARALKWSDGYRVAGRTAAAAAARSATLAEANEDVTYAAAKAAADAAVRAADPDLSAEAAADATAEAVKPFLPSERTGARRKVKLAAGAGADAASDEEDEEPYDDDEAFEESMLLGHAGQDDDGTGGGGGGHSIARSHASEGLATAALLRYARTRGVRERILHARNHAASVRSRLAADRRYHESAAAAAASAACHRAPPPPPPEADAYEVGGKAGRAGPAVFFRNLCQ